MHVDILIIGQGISGTFLQWNIEKAGLSAIVIDESNPSTASKAASGIINPVTGRRIVKTWMIDELLPFALDAYQQIGDELNITCIRQKNIVDFFPSPQMRMAFLSRYEEDASYLHKPAEEKSWNDFFNVDFGYGEIQPCYLVDVITLLDTYRKKLNDKQQLREERFDHTELLVTEKNIQYRDVTASKIIYCDGVQGFSNPLFKNLPAAPNKGEVLVVAIKDMPADRIFKRGLTLAPVKDDLFWVGSSYEWNFEHDQPTAIFRKKTEQSLQQWLKLPFKIIDHIASIRPATLERRPFVGFHPLQKNVGILNGMGAKGCSLAPYFAKQLVDSIMGRPALDPEAAISRFTKILSR